MLNGRDLRTGAGDAFDGVSVQWVRCSAKLKSLKQRLLDAGWLTRRQIADQLGVSRTELGRMRGQGWPKGRICSERGEWLYLPPDRTPTENQGVPVAVTALDNIAADVLREMRMLVVENTDAQVAHMLNERGLRTSTGGAFNPGIVRWVRRSANLESLKDRLLRAGVPMRCGGSKVALERATCPISSPASYEAGTPGLSLGFRSTPRRAGSH